MAGDAPQDAPDDPDEFLPTRQSLLKRIRNPEDQTSWNDFCETYWKLIYGVARRTGLSDSDAQDVVQETLISVVKNIDGFVYDPKMGSFKGWLKRLTKWRVGDFLRKKQYQVKGRRLPKEERLPTAMEEQQESPVYEEMERAWDEEWRQHLRDMALARVKPLADARQYQLFYFHVMKQFPAKDVAERFDIPLNAVYSAKYKLQELLAREVALLNQDE